MKKACLILALLLLLTGCARVPVAVPTPSGSPEAPTPSPSASPVPTPEESGWWENVTLAKLPTEIAPSGSIASVDGPVCLGLVADADIGLYGDPDPTAGILLRKGDALQYFPQVYATGRYTMPELTWADLDGDGTEELAVKYLVEDLDGKIIYELHIYEWDGDVWTDHGFTGSLYRPLVDEILSCRVQDDSIILSTGNDATRVWYEGESEPAGLAPVGNLVFYRWENGGFTVIFGLQLALENGGVRDAATLTARLGYDGAKFSLSDYALESVGGV